MTSIKLYEQITLPTQFTNEILHSIKLIEIDFSFSELLLVKSLIRLFNYTVNAYHLEMRKTPRNAVIKKELQNINKFIKKVNTALKQASLKSHLSFTNLKNHILLNRFQNDLPCVIDEIDNAINKLQDNGGRPKYSIQEFITFNLLIIYFEGTKKNSHLWLGRRQRKWYGRGF